jgi:hypothetical protein
VENKIASGVAAPRITLTGKDIDKATRKKGRSGQKRPALAYGAKKGDDELPKRAKGEDIPRQGEYRYGNNPAIMRDHRKWLLKSLRQKFSRDEEGEDIIASLLQMHPKPAEYAAGPYGDSLKRLHYLECVASIEAVWTVAVCGQVYSYSGGSMNGYNRARKVMSMSYDPDSKLWNPRLIPVGDGLPGVPAPCLVEGRTIKRHRDESVPESGVRHLNQDGSAVVAWTYNDVLIRSIIGKGKEWLKARGNKVEYPISGDAHQGSGKKWSHVTARVMDVYHDASSPNALWGLVHYMGGDDWDCLDMQCTGVFYAMRQLRDHGDKVSIVFPATETEIEEEIEVTVKRLFCADGAMIDSEQGSSGFASKMPCPFCTAPNNKTKKDLLNEKEPYEKKTLAWLNNAAHLPECYPCSDPTKFKPFTCPIGTCNKRFETMQEVIDEEEVEGRELTRYKGEHCHYHKKWKLFPVETKDVIMCTLHMCLAYVRHDWKHALSEYINDDEVADYINDLLKVKCGVVADSHKISNGLKIDASLSPRMPGAAARLVAEHFDVLLWAVLFWNNENLNSEVRQKHFQKCQAVNDALIKLWNTLSLKMERAGPGLPPSLATRTKKAKLLGVQSKMYRLRYKKAFGVNAAKPYTHMSMHLEEMQMNLEWDIVDYSGQAQEHFGKICRTIIANNTNHHLAKEKKDGTMSDSVVLQMAKNLMYRRVLNELVPIPPTNYSKNKLKKKKAGEKSHQMVKSEEAGSLEVKPALSTSSKNSLVDEVKTDHKALCHPTKKAKTDKIVLRLKPPTATAVHRGRRPAARSPIAPPALAPLADTPTADLVHQNLARTEQGYQDSFRGRKQIDIHDSVLQSTVVWPALRFRIIREDEITNEFVSTWADYADSADNSTPTGKKLSLRAYTASLLSPRHAKGRSVCVLMKGSTAVTLRVVHTVTQKRRGNRLESAVMVTPDAERGEGHAKKLTYEIISNRRQLGINAKDDNTMQGACRSVATRPFYESLVRNQPPGMGLTVHFSNDIALLRWRQ